MLSANQRDSGSTRPRPRPAPRTPRGSADALANNASMRAAAQRQATPGPNSFVGGGGTAYNTNSDPHNWAGIAAALAAQNQPGHYGSADAAAARLDAGELDARRAGEERAAAYVPPAPVMRQSGSGRSTSDFADGGGMAAPSPVFAAPETFTAPPAVVQPPAVVAQAPESAVNVPGESFTTVGKGPGTFGGYERRRQARGPRTGLSVTPEMLQRAAMQRMG